MANFYWVGGETGTTGGITGGYDGLSYLQATTGTGNWTWVRAFDFNNPLNWRIGTGSGFQVNFIGTNRAPGGGETVAGNWTPDSVYFCYDGFNGTGSTVLPRAKAPCLFGGCTVGTNSNAGVTWTAGGAGGLNIFGATAHRFIYVDIQKNGLARTNGTSNYDFSFIGGGFAGATYTSFPTTEYNPLLDATSKGFTLNSSIWGGASWNSLVVGFLGSTYGANERYSKLRLKMGALRAGVEPSGAGISSVENSPGSTSPSVLNQGIVSIVNVPAYNSYGSGATAISSVGSFAQIYGPAHYILSGRWLEITRNGVCRSAYAPVSGTSFGALAKTGLAGVFNSPFGRPRQHLTLNGVTASSVKSQVGTSALYFGAWTTCPQCQFGQLYHIVPDPKSWLLEIDGSGFRRADALLDLGISGATSAPVPNIEISEFGSDEVINPGNPANRHGIWFGNASFPNPMTKGVTANWVKINGSGGVSTIARVTLNTNTYVNQFDIFVTNISAGPDMTMNKYLKIETLTMKRGTSPTSNENAVSTLDLSKVGSFDNWEFGYQQNNQIVGGIVSLNEGNIIRGSQGVNLFNEQLISQLRSSGSRGGAKTTPATLIGEDFI
jgi:hypothetical protein